MDTVRADGEHEQYERVVLTADATFTTREAEAFAVSILRAVRQLDAGLPGTPGGIPACCARCRGRGRRRGGTGPSDAASR
jgi:hypothetical protein